jgi:hypothetical protein
LSCVRVICDKKLTVNTVIFTRMVQEIPNVYVRGGHHRI